MIIKKLNNLFHKHSRWLFGAFTIVIIVSFMGFLTPGQFGCDGFGVFGTQKVGTVYGKAVSFEDLDTLIRENYMLSLLGLSMGREIGYQEAFQEYCLLAAARKRGLAVGDKEIVDFVKTFPAFQKDGKYSPEAYKEFKNMMYRDGGSDDLFVGALRNMLLITKLQAQLGDDTMVTDNEVETFYRRINVRYDVKAALFAAEDYLKEVKNDPQAMKDFFDAHRKEYVIGGKIGALLVEFPAAKYVKEAEARATEPELKKFYAGNPQLFTKDSKVRKFEDCRKQVKAEFVKAVSRDIATRTAYEFAGAAYDAVSEAAEGRTDAFRKVAAAAGAEVVDAGMVDFDAPAVGKISSPEFLQNLIAAFDTHWVTNPAVVGESVFVGFAKDKLVPRPAEFNEVSARIAADYRNAEAMRLADEAAKKAEESLAPITDGPARVKAFNALKGCSFKEFGFVLGSQMPPMDFIPSALAAIRLAPDEISQVLPGETGPQLALLVKRTPADLKGFAEKKELLRSNLRMMKRQMAQGAFWEELTSQCQANVDLSRR